MRELANNERYTSNKKENNCIDTSFSFQFLTSADCNCTVAGMSAVSLPSTWSIDRFREAAKGKEEAKRSGLFLKIEKRLHFAGHSPALTALSFVVAGDRHALVGFSPNTRLPSLMGVDWNVDIECISCSSDRS